jgi:hypothetical protein
VNELQQLPRRAALAAFAAIATAPLSARADTPPAGDALTRYVDAKSAFAVGARFTDCITRAGAAC